jgi:uncharacterized repeat protein (TIGR01451 family)
MMEFGKRLSWRLTGGLVAIALGALAAAQAQRQGLPADLDVPELSTPAWAHALPQPIAADDAFASTGPSSSPIMPAAYAAEMPATGSQADLHVSHPEQQFNDAPPAMMIATVSHEEPMAGPPAQTNEGPMALPSPSFDPAGMMAPPIEEHSPTVADGPGLAMPFMGLPSATAPPQQEEPAAGPEMPMPANMPEIQFDQAPMMMESGPGQIPMMSMRQSDATQRQAMDQPLNNATDMQGVVGDDSGASASAFAGNSLRAESGLPNTLRSAPQPQAPERQLPERDTSLPPLPTPQTFPSNPNYSNDAGPQSQTFSNLPAYPNTSAQFAGHQRGAAPAVMPDAYLGAGNEPISISSPGDRRLEGVQTPSVVIHKRAPAEVKVGKPATFVIQVRNVGTAEALGVLVHDRVPAGMQLVDATPAPTMQGDVLVWQLGAMPAGDERSITMQLVPREEGELGSVARVTFEAAASVRTRSTRPELKITQRAPQKVLIGQQLEIELEVANVGTGEATNVILQADVPPGLDHPRGRQLDNAMGSLRPGEVRREVLRMRAVEPGVIENVVHLVAEDAEPVAHTVAVEVVAPKIAIALAGPSRRFLERQATYMVNIQNSGTAPATNVEIMAQLDRGFTFVGTENNGHYDPNRHAVLWSIIDLPAGESASVPVTLLPIEEGDQVIRLEATADLNSRSESEHTVAVQSQAELTFSIADTADPIELGSETTYEIKVRNAGSRNDTNVQVRLMLPPGIEMLESDSEAGTDGRGGVMFAPHPNLAAGGDLTYRIRVRGVQPDTHIIKAIVTSDQARVPVTKEESTMVYADQ